MLGTPFSCIELNAVIPSCPVYCCAGGHRDQTNSNPNLKPTEHPLEIVTINHQQQTSRTTSRSQTSDTHPVTSSSSNHFKTTDSNYKQNGQSFNGVPNVNHDDDPYSRARFIPDTANGDANHPNTLRDQIDESSTNIRMVNASLNKQNSNNNFNSTTSLLSDHFENTKKRIDEGFSSKYGNVDIQSPNDYSSDKTPDSEMKKKRKRRSRKTKRESSDMNLKGSLFKVKPNKELAKSVEALKLVELNATIGRHFCSTLQCVQGTGPRFSYLIPLSKFMELEYVTLQFR